jgi:hypothetical protein
MIVPVAMMESAQVLLPQQSLPCDAFVLLTDETITTTQALEMVQ